MITQKALKNDKVTVTFQLPKEVEAKSISVMGDFNNWNADALPMTQNKKGKWQARLQLEPDQSYEFRYRLDNGRWLNDDNCASCANPFGTENSVLVVSAKA